MASYLIYLLRLRKFNFYDKDQVSKKFFKYRINFCHTLQPLKYLYTFL